MKLNLDNWRPPERWRTDALGAATERELRVERGRIAMGMTAAERAAIIAGSAKLQAAIERELKSSRPYTRFVGYAWTPGGLDDLYDRLNWLYGPERAAEIMAGQDAATEADIAKWDALGGKR